MPVTTTSPAASDVPGLDGVAARRWLALARGASPWLHEEVGRRMLERLQWFRHPPSSWLHWEPVHGGVEVHALLRERLGGARCLLHASHRGAAQALLGETARTVPWWMPRLRSGPPAPVWDEGAETVGLLWANMQLHMEARPLALLQRWHDRIQIDGFLMFSCLGPDTLKDLRRVYRELGWHEPAHAYTDMHDWGDMLVQTGFAEPVMDMERLTLTFSSAEALLEELRGLGRNLSAGRTPGLRGRAWRRQLLNALESRLPRDADGRLCLGFEIVYGHAYKPAPRPKRESSVSLDEMRAMLRERRTPPG